MKAAAFLCVFLAILVGAKCADILLWTPFVFKSAMVAYTPLVEELSDRGHKVTIVTSYVNDNLKDDINIRQVYTGDFVDDFSKYISGQFLIGKTVALSYYAETCCNHNDHILDLPEVKTVIDNANQIYDMVIVYSDYTCSETGYYIAKRHAAPLVLLSIFQCSWPSLDWAMGQPNNPAYMPNSFTPLKPGEMDFFERLMSTYHTWQFHFGFRNEMFARAETVLDKHFPGEKRRSLDTLEKNASLALSFGHPHLTDGFKPSMPNYIQIGMMLCNKNAGHFKKDDKIGRFLAQGPTVFMSLGTLVRSNNLPKEKVSLFLTVFEKLQPLQVLWKWEDDNYLGLAGKLPVNVMTSKWVPQQDVLAHPNTLAFITHAGQSSFQETLCHKTPTVAIPISFDQAANAYEMEKLGVGIHLDYANLTEDRLLNSLRKVLNDKRYAEKAAQLSDVLTDQIDRPLDRAVWWLEHVLRHPTLYAGKAAVHKLTWFQYFLLDIIGFILVALLVVVFVTYKLAVFLCCKHKNWKRGRKAKTN